LLPEYDELIELRSGAVLVAAEQAPDSCNQRGGNEQQIPEPVNDELRLEYEEIAYQGPAVRIVAGFVQIRVHDREP
jgi:hypothetical protein